MAGSMEKALAVVKDSESAKRLVREAGELAADTDAAIIVLYVTTKKKYKANRKSLEQVPGIGTTYTKKKALEGAQQFAADICREVLGDIDIEYESIGRIGNESEEILTVADIHGCDHIFLTGKKRTPAGKAMFGDSTQSVILNFDGMVTVVTG
jgi:nucleotide-binding universal stress UspA family protein